MSGRADVAIVGGGPAGSAAAIELARSGVRVTLVDGSRIAARKVGEALPPAVNPLLRHLGVWEPMLASGHRRSPGNASLWGCGFAAKTDFIRDPNGSGWHVERNRFDAMLRTSARAHGATLFEQVAVSRMERASDRWRLTLRGRNSARDLDAEWVIDCSGRRSAVARHLHVRRIRFDALVAAVVFLRRGAALVDLDHLTLIEAAPDGWWYTAPLPDDRRVTAYFTDRQDSSVSSARSWEGYARMMATTRAVHGRVTGSGYAAETAPRFVGAGTSRLERFAGRGWAAAGDAAAAFDPLSSQGVFFALRSGLNAARAVRGALMGEPGAVGAYSEGLERAFAAYLVQRGAYYRAEQRWPERPFWHRRHLPVSADHVGEAARPGPSSNPSNCAPMVGGSEEQSADA